MVVEFSPSRRTIDEGREEDGKNIETLWTMDEILLSQQQDPDIGPITKCMKNDTSQPPWKDVASQSPVTKAYWAQWSSLRLKNGVLYRVWLSPTDDRVMQLIQARSEGGFEGFGRTPVGTQKRSNARAIRLECDCRGRTANEHPAYGHISACAIRYTYMIYKTKLTFWKVYIYMYKYKGVIG